LFALGTFISFGLKRGGGAGIWGQLAKQNLIWRGNCEKFKDGSQKKGYRQWAPQTGHKINKTKAKFFFPLLFFFSEGRGAKTKDVSSPFSYFSTLRSVGVARGPQGAMKIIIDVGQNFRAEEKDITSSL